jgi:outer membrane protein OmpA-like peptidoglycan-associated protein/Tol biopolymer transport system component
MKRLLVPLFLLLLFRQPSRAQETGEILRDIFYEAEFMLASEFYVDALTEYKKLFNKGYENNANINYRIGECLINIPGQKTKAIPYLQKAIFDLTPRYQEGIFTETKAPYDAYLYLGNAYRINNQLESAIFAYQKYKELLNKDDSEEAKYADQQIEACTHAQEAMESPVYYIRENLGNTINTRGSDFNPVVSPDESIMVYMTSKKFYDAILFSMKENGKWTEPVNITPEIQSDGDQFANSLSADGTELYLNKSDNFDSDIYMSQYVDGHWTKSSPLNKYINTRFYESHASVSPDKRFLYFSSNRRGGQGEMDLWVSGKNELGDWGEPQNLGKIINTELNEDHPYVSRDGNTLFFTSQGHYSLGGFDVFISEKINDSTWSKPVNLGYPVNTTDDDLFYVPAGQGNVGYQSIYADEGYGSSDIYRYRIFPGEAEYLAYVKQVEQASGQATVKKPEAKPEPRPEPQPEPVVESASVFIIQTIFFGFDNSSLSDESKVKLDFLVEAMKAFPEVKITAIGHADSKGSDSYNLKLSQNRAASARNYLIGKGADPDHIKADARGESVPVAINTLPDGTDCPEGRTFNRRVEFAIIDYPAGQIDIEEPEIPDNLKAK